MIIALKKKRPFSNSEVSESDFNFAKTQARFPASHSIYVSSIFIILLFIPIDVILI